MRKDTIFGLIRFIEILVAATLIAWFINQELRQSCIRAAEIMGYEAHYELKTQCMIKVGGRFIPLISFDTIVLAIPAEVMITTIPTVSSPQKIEMPGTVEMPGTDEPPLPTRVKRETYTPNGALP
jgi:hypothetical protein